MPMTGKQELRKDIESAIKTIENNSKDNIEIHDICIDLYKRYTDLPRTEFASDLMYLDFKKRLEISANTISLEFRGLLNNKDVETSENYFQLKMTLVEMLNDISY